MKVTRQQMKDARLPLNFRDYCAHILIPLNECRRETWFSPYKCTELRHAHEKCEYDECAASPGLEQPRHHAHSCMPTAQRMPAPSLFGLPFVPPQPLLPSRLCFTQAFALAFLQVYA